MAGTNRELLTDLLEGVETQNHALAELFEKLGSHAEQLSGNEPPSLDSVELKPSFQVVVECADEPQQQAVFERLTGEGFKCRVLLL
jgi:hypothetical protein